MRLGRRLGENNILGQLDPRMAGGSWWSPPWCRLCRGATYGNAA